MSTSDYLSPPAENQQGDITLTPEEQTATDVLASCGFEDIPLADYIARGIVATPDDDVVRQLTTPFTPLVERFAWSKGLGWLGWDGKRWASVSTETVGEAVRKAVRATYLAGASNATTSAALNTLKPLLAYSKVTKVTDQLRGILEVRPEEFDAHPDLLNVQNGVVDLRTGDLMPHDAAYRFTKITKGRYGVNTTHADWLKTLKALPDDVRGYMQYRYGQALTGYMASDDKLAIQQGGGRNAKSTLVNAVVNAAGDYACFVPEAVLTAGPNAHPTEMMTLRGVRLAVVEELPEGRQLPVKRLKDLVGTQRIQARYMRQDFVTFDASHSLFVNTNYVPKVAETDHGTWERLLLIRFPYTYLVPPEVPLDPERERVADPGLRGRMERGDEDVWDAVLFWAVQGAVKWYADGRTMPPIPDRILSDTLAWRQDADLILAYLTERMDIDPDASVAASELYEDFKAWLILNEHPAWTPKTFVDRFGSHKVIERANITSGVTRTHANVSRRSWGVSTMTALPEQVKVWRGLRYKRQGVAA